MKQSDYQIIESKIIESIQDKNSLNNSEIVQLIELLGGYLNLKTIPEYAKQNKLSYNGVKKHRTIKNIFGVKFVIDND